MTPDNPTIIARYVCQTSHCHTTIDIPIVSNSYSLAPLENMGWEYDNANGWRCYRCAKPRKLCPQCNEVRFIRGYRGYCTIACFERAQEGIIETEVDSIISAMRKGIA